MSLNESGEETKVNTKQISKPKVALRGKTAALLANLSSSSDSETDSEPKSGLFKPTINNRNQHLQNHAKQGIYSVVVNETKQSIKATHTKLDKIEKQILNNNIENNKENISSTKLKKKKENKNGSSSQSDSFSNDDNDSDSNSVHNLNSSSSSSSSPFARSFFKSKPIRERSNSPPPPPIVTTKKKRKSTTIVDRQLKELDSIKNIQNSPVFVNDEDDTENEDVFNLVTVRVSTKNGVKKFEINKNDEFLKIYEKLSQLEQVEIQNIALILQDRKIGYHDTPESIDLQVFDIIEFNKIVGKKVDRIQIIDRSNEDEVYSVPNKIMITFQTSEGRKSRVTFQINKDESFGNVLKVYCEKKELGDSSGWMMEFDGERVDLDENANDLDLDGDEIFDVKKSSKSGASLDVIKSNQNNYDFDDDILIA